MSEGGGADASDVGTVGHGLEVEMRGRGSDEGRA